MSSITIRHATRADAEFLVRGNAEMALETEGLSLDLDRLGNGVHAVFDDPGRGFYLIAEVEGRRAGQLMITYEWSDWRNGVFWWIQSVYVVPEFRNRGVYRTLHREVEARAKAAGNVCGIRLYVETENLRAQSTYVKCGLNQAHYLIFEDDFTLRRS